MSDTISIESGSADDPCKCHRTFAYVSPRHSGHCCFWPETQTCHAAEVTEWRRRARLVQA